MSTYRVGWNWLSPLRKKQSICYGPIFSYRHFCPSCRIKFSKARLLILSSCCFVCLIPSCVVSINVNFGLVVVHLISSTKQKGERCHNTQSSTGLTGVFPGKEYNMLQRISILWLIICFTCVGLYVEVRSPTSRLPILHHTKMHRSRMCVRVWMYLSVGWT